MATLRYLLDVNAPNAAKTFDQVGGRLTELDRALAKTRDISIGDRDAMAKLTRTQIAADRLRDRLSGMPLTIEGAARAEASLLGIEATADRLDRKLGGRGIGGGGRGGILGRLGAAAGAAGSAGQGIGGALSAAGPYVQGGVLGAGAITAAALAPAAIPTVLGAGLGGLGAFLSAGKQIGKIFSDAFDQVKRDVAPLRPLFVSVFSFLPGLARSIGPGLRDVFAEAVPYLKTFAGLLGPIARTLLPVFSQSLRQMTPFLPMISQGLLRIVKGFAGFIQAIGPSGMQGAAKIFVVVTKVMEAVLIGLGHTVNWLAENIPKWVHDIAKWWDWMRHHTATVFDGIRHDIAHYWDMIFENSVGMVIRLAHDVERDWNDFRHRTAVVFDGVRHDVAHIWDLIWNNTIGRVERGLHDVAHDFDTMRHDIASTFDTIRHNIAHDWDVIWQNTIGRVIRGIGDVIGWFRGIPGRVAGALRGLGTLLYNLGHGWLVSMWNGIKRVWNDVIGWFRNLPGNILHAIGIHSPPDWAVHAGEQIMKGLHIGMKGTLHTVLGLAGSLGHLITSGVSAILPGGIPAAGNVGGVAALAKAMAAARGWTGTQWDALNAVEMREAGWNLRAVNPSSGAYGIAQFIGGPSEYYRYGGNPNTAAGQITGFLNYVAQRYGNPVAAWAHEQRFGWYGSGLDAMFTRPTLIGVGERGPERVQVTPGTRGGGNTYITYNTTVKVPPSANMAEVGRVTVEAIRQYEKRSGTSWRTR